MSRCSDEVGFVYLFGDVDGCEIDDAKASFISCGDFLCFCLGLKKIGAFYYWFFMFWII